MLGQRFLARYCAAQGLPLDSKAFSREAIELLVALSVAGQHSRARKSTVSCAALSAPGGRFVRRIVEFCTQLSPCSTSCGAPSVAGRRRATHVARVLESVKWNKKEAARVLEISRGTLYRKIEVYALAPETRKAGRHGKEEETS